MSNETLLQPPKLGPQMPVYPALPQVVRKYGAAMSGTNAYAAFTQQYAGLLTFRDREPSYIFEPNGVSLSDGLYDCRLVGSFPVPGDPHFGSVAQLPLYAATASLGGGNTIQVTDGSVTYTATTLEFPPGSVTNLGGGVIGIALTGFSGDLHTYRTSGGRFTSPVTTAARQDGNKIPCGQIYLYPFPVPVVQFFKRLEIFLTANGLPGSLLQLAIYNTQNAVNDRPLSPVVNTGDIAIDAGAGGYVGQNIPLTTLLPGLYYLAANSNLLNSGIAQWRSGTEIMHILGVDPTTAPYFTWIDGTNKGSADGTPYGVWPAGAGMVNLHKDNGQETATIWLTVN